MKYVRKTWPASYYTDVWEWRRRRSAEEMLDLVTGKSVMSNLQNIEPISNDPKEAERQRIASLRRYLDEMTSQLSKIRGLVFVDGNFERSVVGTDLTLLHNVTEIALLSNQSGPKVSFRVTVPAHGLQPLPHGTQLRVKVFGNVTKPLGKDGFVDVAPVAIWF